MGKKDITIKVRLSPDELKMIQEKMEQFGTDNMSAFIRKMAIDGYIIYTDTADINLTVAVVGNSQVTITHLPVGDYVITELTSWFRGVPT